MSKSKRKRDQNLQAIKAQMLVVGLVLLIVACVLLGLDLSEHLGPAHGHSDKTNVNIKVSTSCVSSQPSWPVVTGNG